MRRQIKKHLRDFIAIIGLVVLAFSVGGYVLAHQRFSLPGWVPIVGHDYYTVNAQFRSGQGVLPGQGQEVRIAGVKVGSVSNVQLEDGQAVVTMQIEKKYAPVYKNAQLLLSPRTLLKDENVVLDPGTASAGAVSAGQTLPQANTTTDVNLDEIWGSLDTDTRQYLKLLLSAGAQGLNNNSESLSKTLGELNVTTRYLAQINGEVAKRRANLSHLVHNMQLLLTRVGQNDKQLAAMVDSVNANFQALADHDSALSESIGLLPGTLQAAKTGLQKTSKVANLIGPTLSELQPATLAAPAAINGLRRVFLLTEPIVRKQLRPFAREAIGPVSDLNPAAKRLVAITPDIASTFTTLNYLFDELAYRPSGAQSVLFWSAWAAHNLASVVSTQDAHGPKLRGGILGMRCVDVHTINALSANANSFQGQFVSLLALNLSLPPESEIC